MAEQERQKEAWRVHLAKLRREEQRLAGDTSIIPLLIDAFKDLATTVANFADRIVTKELVATNVMADRGTFNELCVKDGTGAPVCVAGDQLRSLLAGSALGASSHVQHPAEEAAGAPTEEDGGGAPARLPAPTGSGSTSIAASTTPAFEASSTPVPLSPSSPESDDEPIPSVEATGEAAEPKTDPAPVPAPQAANDNTPPMELPATDTE